MQLEMIILEQCLLNLWIFLTNKFMILGTLLIITGLQQGNFIFNVSEFIQKSKT